MYIVRMFYENVIVKRLQTQSKESKCRWPIEERNTKKDRHQLNNQKEKPKVIDKNAEKFESTDVMTFIKRHATTRVVRKRVKYRYSSNNQQIHKT